MINPPNLTFKWTSVVFLSSLFLFVGCYYDNEEELYSDTCDSENVSYSNDVLSIIERNCYICHAAEVNQGGVTLEGYEALKDYVDDGSLIGAITHSSGYVPMPEDAPKLSDCNIAIIQSWVDDGAPNN